MVVCKTSFDWEFCSNNDDGSSLTEMFRMTFLGTTLIYCLWARYVLHASDCTATHHMTLTHCHQQSKQAAQPSNILPWWWWTTNDRKMQSSPLLHTLPPGGLAQLAARHHDQCPRAPPRHVFGRTRNTALGGVRCFTTSLHGNKKIILSMVASRDLKSRVHVNSGLK